MLQQKIQSYLQKNSIRHLQRALNVGAGTILAIRDGTKQQFSRKIIEKMYDFFELKKDAEFEKLCLQRRTNSDILGDIFYKKRLALGQTIFYVSAQTKISERQIMRIEGGKVRLKNNSYAIEMLMKYFDFTETERESMLKYLQYCADLHKIYRK